jgi:hypothetical protein
VPPLPHCHMRLASVVTSCTPHGVQHKHIRAQRRPRRAPCAPRLGEAHDVVRLRWVSERAGFPALSRNSLLVRPTRRSPVDSASVVIRRLAAYQWRFSSSARDSSSRYALSTAATDAASSVSVSRSRIDGRSTRSSGFLETHLQRRAVLNINPTRTRWFRTVLGESPAASFVAAYRSNASGRRESVTRSWWSNSGRR